MRSKSPMNSRGSGFEKGQVDYTYRGKTREITFLLRDRYFVNLDQPILIYVAANGPKALTAAGSYGDGWITAGGPGLLLVTSRYHILERGRTQHKTRSVKARGRGRLTRLPTGRPFYPVRFHTTGETLAIRPSNNFAE